MIEAGKFLQQRYRIDKQIGQGGMGAVYVATDERFGSTVAIKETLCMDDNFRKAIEREARLLNSLKHSALPRVSDHFLEDDGQFLVMEYVQGEDLAHMLEREHAVFPVETVVNWADQLLDALDYLHTQEIPVVHRDIKPQNLKLTSRGQIVLLDFGLAKGNPTDAGHQTAAKSIFGYSRSYASLEQIQGTGTDPRSDLYSLAATLYHLLTGVPPEDALTRAMAVLSRQPDPLVPANAVRREIPAGVAGILQKAMDLNATGRPASAAEMRQMFRESDKYAYLAEAVTAPVLNVAAAIPQPTGIMPDHTHPASVRQTDVKTEVLPSFNSELTSIRPGTAAAAAALTSMPSIAPKRRGFGIAVGAAAVVLLGFLGAAGLFLANRSYFSTATPPSDQPAKETSVSTQPVVDVPANQSAPIVAGGEPAAGGAGDGEAQKHIVEVPKTNETATAPKNNKTGPGRTQNNRDDSGDIQIGEGSDLPDGMTVTRRDQNGRVTTMRPIPPSVRDPGDGTSFPKIDPSQFGEMTPLQRRKLQQAIRNAQRQQQGLEVFRPKN